MGRTKEEMSKMTRNKENSKKMVDRLVMDELLEMGFSYSNIGTYYLHDGIVISTSMKLEKFNGLNEFYKAIKNKVGIKYNISGSSYSSEIERSIERAFLSGNINYLLNTFKGSYDYEKAKVKKNVFIMTVRRKIMETLERQGAYSATQLRLIIQGSVEGITDYVLLKGICDIVLSVGNRESA